MDPLLLQVTTTVGSVIGLLGLWSLSFVAIGVLTAYVGPEMSRTKAIYAAALVSRRWPEIEPPMWARTAVDYQLGGFSDEEVRDHSTDSAAAREVMVAALVTPPMTIEDVTRDAEALTRQALERLYSWADDDALSLSRLIIGWQFQVWREHLRLMRIGVLRVGLPWARVFYRDAASRCGGMTVFGVIVGVVSWRLFADDSGRSWGMDWGSYVGWWISVSAIVGFLGALWTASRPFASALRAQHSDAVPSRVYWVAVAGCVGLMLWMVDALPRYQPAMTAWLLQRMPPVGTATSAALGGILMLALLIVGVRRQIRTARDRDVSEWARREAIETASAALCFVAMGVFVLMPAFGAPWSPYVGAQLALASLVLSAGVTLWRRWKDRQDVLSRLRTLEHAGFAVDRGWYRPGVMVGGVALVVGVPLLAGWAESLPAAESAAGSIVVLVLMLGLVLTFPAGICLVGLQLWCRHRWVQRVNAAYMEKLRIPMPRQILDSGVPKE